jgi:hypothetical protein
VLFCGLGDTSTDDLVPYQVQIQEGMRVAPPT